MSTQNLFAAASHPETYRRFRLRGSELDREVPEPEPLILLAARHHSVTAADGQIGDHRHNHRSVTARRPSTAAHEVRPAWPTWHSALAARLLRRHVTDLDEVPPAFLERVRSRAQQRLVPGDTLPR